MMIQIPIRSDEPRNQTLNQPKTNLPNQEVASETPKKKNGSFKNSMKRNLVILPKDLRKKWENPIEKLLSVPVMDWKNRSFQLIWKIRSKEAKIWKKLEKWTKTLQRIRSKINRKEIWENEHTFYCRERERERKWLDFERERDIWWKQNGTPIRIRRESFYGFFGWVRILAGKFYMYPRIFPEPIHLLSSPDPF